jgi:hypothetical protein
MPKNEETKQENLSPILKYVLTCPICDFDEVHFYSLRAKSIPSRPNILEVPLYEASAKYMAVDFNEMYFSVCPKCCYVGSKKNDFHSVDTISQKLVKANLDANLYRYWKESKAEIDFLLTDCFFEEGSFYYPRTEDGVMASLKLGIHRATKEIQFKNPYALYRRAKYKIRFFYLFRKFYKKNNPEILADALVDLEEVFRISDFPEKSYEYEVCFLIIVASLMLEKETKAQDYIRVLDQTKGELTQKARLDPKINTTEIQKWLNRAKNLWSARSDLDTFEIMKPTKI